MKVTVVEEPQLAPFTRGISDICSNRHGGQDTSRAAFDRLKPFLHESQQVVFDLLKAAYPVGLTVKDIAGMLGKQMSSISPRLTELREMNIAVKTIQRRDGCAVIRWNGVNL